MPRIVHEKDDLRAPKFDMFRLQSQEVLPHLVIDEVLRDITPSLWWRKVMDE